jgi:rubrerythrin
MTQSEEFLMQAFAGESQANHRYLAFASQAEKEGYPQVAKLFRAVAEAETVHARAHLRVAGGIRSTAENLKTAISGETHEFKVMYPAMIGTAMLDGNKAAEQSFSYAKEVEKVHALLFEKPWPTWTNRPRWSTVSVPCAVIPGKSSRRKAAIYAAPRSNNLMIVEQAEKAADP